jgi:hypothetical protein
MPHLRILKRNYRISSDDFPLPVGCSLFWRVLWAIMLGIATAVQLSSGDRGCQSYGLPAYMVFTILLFCFSMITGSLVMREGMKGSIVETEERKDMDNYLIAHTILMILQFICAIFGMVLFASTLNIPCFSDDSNYTLLLLAIVVFTQITDSCCVFCCFIALAGNRIDDATIESMSVNKVADEVWEKRVSKCVNRLSICNCIGGGSSILENDVIEFAHELSKLFNHKGFLDLVPGDVAAGLLLVRAQQRQTYKDVLRNDAEALELEINVDDLVIEFDEADSPSSGRAIPDKHSSSSSSSSESSPPKSSRKRNGKSMLIGADGVTGTKRRGLTLHALRNRRKLENKNAEDCKVLQALADMAPYAISLYTVACLMLVNPITFPCRLCYTGMENCGKHPRGEVIFGETPCCGCHEAANLHHLRRKENSKKAELIYANFNSTVGFTPYAMYLDHINKSVVIAIRGTLSLDDCITDVQIETISLSHYADKHGVKNVKDRYAHRGFAANASNIIDDIEEHGILAKVVLGDEENAALHPDYKIKVCGHSLGAGITPLVGYFLRGKYEPDKIHCYCFAPNPSTVDPATAEEMKEYVTSMILGNDVVSNASLHNVLYLRERVLDSLARAKTNKTYIWQSIYKDFHPRMLLHDEIPESRKDFQECIQNFLECTNEHLDLLKPQLAMPGKIIHLVEDESYKTCGVMFAKRYIPYEVSKEFFMEIKVTGAMLMDHRPDYYCDRLDETIENLEFDI